MCFVVIQETGFARLDHIAEDIVIVKVESLTAARKSAMSGSEPSDAIRVVNAVLTQIDQIKRWLSIYI